MGIKNIIAAAAVMLTAASASASPIAGVWQGPCEVRAPKSVKFTYTFSELNDEGVGSLAKVKIYYNDDACSDYARTGRATVSYKLGEPVDGIYPLDVNHRGSWFYDIVTVSEDGLVLTFGDEDATDPANRPTNLSTTDRVFLKAEQ